MDNKIDEFKNFIKSNPFLIGYIRDGKKSWQDLYEVYDLYGEDEDVWSEYLKDKSSDDRSSSNSNNGTNYWSDIVKMAKNIDVNKVQEGITSLQKTLSLFGDLFVNKESSGKTYNPRPLYRRFED